MKFKYLFLIIWVMFFLSCKEKNDIQKVLPIRKETPTRTNTPQSPTFHKLERPKFTKGLYLSAWTVASKKFSTILDSAEAAGINTIVFDLKNMNGDIFFDYKSDSGLGGKNIKKIINIDKVTKELHKRKMRSVGRVVLFHDQYLAKIKPDFRPQTSNGTAWRESKRNKPSWLDSSNPKVQKYVLLVIKSILKHNIDEIQLDYTRFPTQGKQSNVIFNYQIEDNKRARRDSTYVKRNRPGIIGDFVSRVYKLCEKKKVSLGGDIFAIVAWQRKVDVKSTGQDIEKITSHLNAIHPMIYSSHFDRKFNFRRDIWNEPYFIVFKGTKLTKKHSVKGCKIIPYIQANSWHVNYKPAYIYAQIQAIKDLNADGYILWNASNKYFLTLRWIKKFR